MSDTPAKPAKDYGGRDPYVIPIPSNTHSIKVMHVGRSIHGQRMTHGNVHALKHIHLYAFHEVTSESPNKKIWAHDIYPDIQLSAQINSQGMTDLNIFKANVLSCNSKIKARRQAELGIQPAAHNNSSQAQKKAESAKKNKYIPVPVWRGEKAHSSRNFVSRLEKSRVCSREYFERHYLAPAGFEYYSEHVDMTSDDNYDAWLYTHKDFPLLEVSIPYNHQKQVVLENARPKILGVNKRLQQLYAQEAPPAKPMAEKPEAVQTAAAETAPAVPEQHFTVRIGTSGSGLTVDSKGDEISLHYSYAPFLVERYTHDANIDDLPADIRREKVWDEFERHIGALSEGLLGIEVMQDLWREKLGGSIELLPQGFAFHHPLLKTPREITPQHPASPQGLAEMMKQMTSDIYSLQHHRMERLRKLTFRGYELDFTPECITVHTKDPGFKPVRLLRQGEDGLFVQDPLYTLMRLEEQHIRKVSLEKVHAAGERRRLKKEQAAIQPAPAPLQQAIFIFDSGPLIDLFNKRPGADKRLWIDFVDVLNMLPTTKYIIVPSISADWELLGRAPTRRNILDSNTRLEQIDQRNSIIERWQLDIRDPYFRHFNRLALLPGGVQEWINGSAHDSGAENKFVVWESQQQADFYAELLGSIANRHALSNSNADAVSHGRRTIGRDAGELACLRIAQSIEDDYPVFIVSNDRDFRRSIYEAIGKRSLHTHGGRGITVLTAIQLIKQMANACGDDFTPFLSALSESNEPPTRFSTFAQSIATIHGRNVAQGLEHQNEYTAAYKADGSQEIFLQSILREGFTALNISGNPDRPKTRSTRSIRSKPGAAGIG